MEEVLIVTPEFKKSFLSVVRQGIGNGCAIPDSLDWQAIQSLANKQGLAAVITDGIESLPDAKRPPKVLLLQGIGQTLQNYESRFELYQQAVAELASWYNSRGYKMMVLKGYACGLNWPKGNHRPYGDIDIWVFGKQKNADSLLAKEMGIKVDSSHHHHTVFRWQGFMVENHYDFVNVHTRKSSAELEKIFKELGKDDSYSLDVLGESVYLPSPNLHALFLIRHLTSHFTAAEINLRQVLDWAFFVEKHTKEVDWAWLMALLEKFHMKGFFDCINAICVEDLGFSSTLFPVVQFLPNLKERVLNDIIDPAFPTAEPKGLFKRLVYKFRRWQGNAWKQEMCYGESRWSTFWLGVWAKILKPASI